MHDVACCVASELDPWVNVNLFAVKKVDRWKSLQPIMFVVFWAKEIEANTNNNNKHMNLQNKFFNSFFLFFFLQKHVLYSSSVAGVLLRL